MVNLTIDNRAVSVPEGTTIMQAALQLDIHIPHLCFLKEINEIAACRVCVVEVEGKDRLFTACNSVVEPDMVVHTNSPKVMRDRRKTVEMILSEHDCKCATCVRSGNCSLQKLSNDLNIQDVPFHTIVERASWDKTFPLIKDSAKCIKCQRCISVCDKVQSLGIWQLESTGSLSTVNVSLGRSIREADCSLCGQCITHCPVGALRERDDTDKVWDAMADPNKTVVFQIAPAIRTAWGEYFGMDAKEATVNKIADALKRMGADYVFDTVFSADLTIMEEATEFIHRFTEGDCKNMPMFTSCCPGWVRFLKSQYPHLTPRLSTAKSPQQMFGAVMKSYFAQSIGKKPEDIFTVSIMPCVAKKGESNMELYFGEYAGRDTDVVLTNRELVRMLRASHIDPHTLEDIPFDRLMRDGSGAGVIFGATGGVMEAALRTAYFLITGSDPEPDAFSVVRAQSDRFGVNEATVNINGIEVKAAVVSGLGNTRKLIDALERGEVHYDFVEVMACPGGCVGGGGQPIHEDQEMAYSRGKTLYFLDANAKVRFSHHNEDIQKLYEDYMEKPNSHRAHMLLHTDHDAWEMPKAPRKI